MEETAIKIEEYKVLNEQIQRRDDLYWTFFAMFVVANVILLVGTILMFDMVGVLSRIVLALFGLAASIVWLFLSGRCVYHRDSLIAKVEEIEKNLLINGKRVLEIWDKTKRIKPRSFIETYSATSTSIGAIIGIAIFWLIVLIYALIIEFNII